MNFEIVKFNTPLAESAIYLLEKYAKEIIGDKTLKVEFLVDSTLNDDAFRIEVTDDEISVFGNTAVGFNAAVGHILRRQNGIIQSTTVEFENNFRGVYFANHFYN